MLTLNANKSFCRFCGTSNDLQSLWYSSHALTMHNPPNEKKFVDNIFSLYVNLVVGNKRINCIYTSHQIIVHINDCCTVDGNALLL